MQSSGSEKTRVDRVMHGWLILLAASALKRNTPTQRSRPAMTIDQAKHLLSQGEIKSEKEHLLGLSENGLETRGIWLLLAGVASRGEGWSSVLRAFKELVRLRPTSVLPSSVARCLNELRMYRETLIEIGRLSTEQPTRFGEVLGCVCE